MKRTITSILFLYLIGMIAWAQTVYTPDNLPKVHLQDKTRYLCDPENILDMAARDSIDRMLYALEQQTGIQTVVAVVPTIGEADCFDFCHQLLNSWGVGQKGKDNGLVVLLVTDQRCIQFYTGYGLEGPLPDAICKRIQTREMIPYLKDNRWSEGMVAGPPGRFDGKRPAGRRKRQRSRQHLSGASRHRSNRCIPCSHGHARSFQMPPVRPAQTATQLQPSRGTP